MKYYIHSSNDRFPICCFDNWTPGAIESCLHTNGLIDFDRSIHLKWKSIFTLVEVLQYYPIFKKEFSQEIITIKVWE